jgi:hypothetical protein
MRETNRSSSDVTAHSISVNLCEIDSVVVLGRLQVSNVQVRRTDMKSALLLSFLLLKLHRLHPTLRTVTQKFRTIWSAQGNWFRSKTGVQTDKFTGQTVAACSSLRATESHLFKSCTEMHRLVAPMRRSAMRLRTAATTSTNLLLSRFTSTAPSCERSSAKTLSVRTKFLAIA